jgi:hypothetical protein
MNEFWIGRAQLLFEFASIREIRGENKKESKTVAVEWRF